MAGLFEGGFGKTEVRPYQPNLRDWVAGGLLGMGMPRGSVQGLLGSTGLGPEGMGLVDTPALAGGLLGVPFAVDEAARTAGTPEGTLNAMAVMPGAKPAAALAGDVASTVARRGDEILGLLRAGRGREVTDEMLVMGDPAETARLNAYLYENYDLPMDEMSRAARASQMGRDAKGYTGTDQDFPAFNAAAWIAHDPKVAGWYATRARARTVMDEADEDFMGEGMGSVDEIDPHMYLAEQGAGPDGEVVMPLVYPRKGLRDLTDLGDAPDPEDLWEALERQGVAERPDDLEQAYWDVDLDPSDRPTLWNQIEQLGLERDFSDAGDAGYVIDDVVAAALPGAGRGVTRGHESVRVFDPANIRSRWARFDPRLSHLRNLSAGLAGGAVGLGAMGGLLGDPQQAQAAPRELLGYSTGGGF